MRVIEQLGVKHIEQLHQLYAHEWWTDQRTLEETEQVIANSSLVIGIVDKNDDLVAFARVLTDFIFRAIIFDVIVEKNARNLGLGHKLIHLIHTHDKMQEVEQIELYCHPEMEGYYEKDGYACVGEHVSLMRKRKKTIL